MFIKKLIHFDQAEFNRNISKTHKELKTYRKIEIELLDLLEIKEITDNKELSILNPLKYLELEIKKKYSNLPFSFDKLIHLAELDLSPLNKLIREYKPTYLKLENNKIVTPFKDEQFKQYTKNQSENTRLKNCLDFIDIFFKLSEKGFNNQNLHKITTMTSNKIRYDAHTDTLIPSYEYIISPY
jgi:hypothetical protein